MGYGGTILIPGPHTGSCILFTKYYSNDQIKEDEKGGACSMPSGDEKCIQKFSWKPSAERDHLEDLDICGIIL
jgi:hypothetical protein